MQGRSEVLVATVKTEHGVTMNGKQQQKGGNKKRRKGKGTGKGKGRGRGGARKKGKNAKNRNKKQRAPKLGGIFNLDSLPPSAPQRVELLVSGFVRKHAKTKSAYSPYSADCTQCMVGYSSNTFSILSEQQCRCLVEQFVERKLIKNKKHKFECILNGQCDGFDAETFHRKCNHKGPTLVVVESNWGRTFGAYSSSSWTPPNRKKGAAQYALDYDAFLFSFCPSTDKLEVHDIEFKRAHFAVQHTAQCQKHMHS